MKIETKNKILAGVGIIGLVSAGVTGAVAYGSMNSAKDTIQTLSEQVDALKALPAKEVITEVKVEVPVDKIVNVTKEVLVDNGNLKLVLEEIYDAPDDNVEYLTDGLDDDELNQIVDRIVFQNDAVALAEADVKKNGINFMDDEDVFDTGLLADYSDDDVYSFKLADEDEDSVIDSIDYEDKEATVLVEMRVKVDDDVKKTVTALFEVEIEDGKAEIVDVTITP